jgi:hypothetical protein
MGVIFTFLIGLFMAFEPITDDDWFWHYVVGNWVNNNHAIPTHELFSWFGNYSWTAHEWLTELIMYKLTPLGCLIIMLIIFFFLYLLMAKMLRVNIKKTFDFKLLYLLLMTIFFKVTGPRPYIISLLFFAYLVYVLFNFVDKEKWSNKLIWSIPILQILWVNLHGGSSSMSYIFILGVLICDGILRILPVKIERLSDTKLDNKQVKTLFIVLGLTILASMVNPFGIKMLVYPFSNMADNSMLDYIVEWASASFHGFFGLYLFIMLAFPLFNLILTKDKVKIHEVGFQLLLLYMALKSQRFIGMYGIYSTWNLGKYFFIKDDFYNTIKSKCHQYEKLIKYSFYLFLIVVIVLVGYKQTKSFMAKGLIDNDGFYSDASVETIINLKPQRLYNDYSQGGYLLYKLNEDNALDQVKVFGYGLGDVFSRSILPDSVNLSDLYKDPREILNKYDFDVILTTKNHTLHYYLDECEDYKLVYSDNMCYIYQHI